MQADRQTRRKAWTEPVCAHIHTYLEPDVFIEVDIA